MTVTHDRVGVRGRSNAACALILLLVTVALVPLAAASSPDPLLIAGIYSPADYDEIVSMLADTVAAVSPERPALPPLILSGPITRARAWSVVAFVTVPLRPRAPPRI